MTAFEFKIAKEDYDRCSHCGSAVEVTSNYYLNTWWAVVLCATCGMEEEIELNPRNEAGIRY